MPVQSNKGNPASIRQGNASKKALRTKSFTAGQIRKQERRRKQEEAHKRNLAAGITPWQLAQATRRKKRAPLHELWLKRQTS